MLFFQINVTNVGLSAATGVKPQLPNVQMLSIISFGNSAKAYSPNSIFVLNSGESALLVLSVNPSPDLPIGIYPGQIAISSLETYAYIYFRYVL